MRHGQASFGKENYDNLSHLGLIQSKRLNEYLQKESLKFDLCITGKLIRHQQTKENTIKDIISNNYEELEIDILNEFPESLWKKIAQQLSEEDKEFARISQRVLQIEKKSKLFFKLAERIIVEWKKGRTPEGEESYQNFRNRVLTFPELLEKKSKKSKSIIVFSSGTPISILLSYYSKIPEKYELNWLTSLWNTSLSILQLRKDNSYFSTINSIPHLDKEERSLI